MRLAALDLAPGPCRLGARCRGAACIFFAYRFSKHAPGRQPCHNAGEAISFLALLGRQPKHNPSVFVNLAAFGEPAWYSFFEPLFNGTECFKRSLGGNKIHACRRIIGSVPAVLHDRAAAAYGAFLDWWSSWLSNRIDESATARKRCVSVFAVEWQPTAYSWASDRPSQPSRHTAQGVSFDHRVRPAPARRLGRGRG